jgi:4-hydroxybenzoate polyprenyltransferase
VLSRLTRLFGFLFYSNIFLSLSVTSLVFETELVLTGKINDFGYALFLFSSTLFLYSFHRIYRFNFRSENEKLSERHHWVKANPVLFYLILTLAGIVSAVCALLFMTPQSLFCLLPVALISFGYTIPCIPRNGNLIRLRDVPGIKIFLISFVLGLTTVYLPLLSTSNSHYLLSSEVMLVFVRRMLFIFAITIPFDIRDMEYDKRTGIHTLPVRFGISRSKYFAYSALFLFVMLDFIQYFGIDGTSPAYALALILSASLAAVVIYFAKPGRKDIFYSFFVEGMMLLQCLLIISAHILLR